ncbi:MAG: hypothetical protein ABSF22_22440 [Bryobacteraceae bacterium]
MNSDAVIGCDAVDAGKEWLRLTTVSGAVRTIPWSAVRLAGMGERVEGQVTMQGVTDRVAPYRATHDSLWIVYGDGDFAQVMLEKASPKRGAIVSTFAQQLNTRWRGDDLSASELTGAMLIPPKVRMPKGIIVALSLVAVAFFLALMILFFLHGAKPTAP